MDAERCRFVFGRDDPPVDPDDEDGFIDWFADRSPDGSRANGMIRGVVARQILLETPPEMWATAQRLTALGLPDDEAIGQLTRVMTIAFDRAMEPDDVSDTLSEGWLERMLDSLPAPTDEEAIAALAVAAGARAATLRSEVIDAALAIVGHSGNDLARLILDRLVDAGLDDGELVELADHRIVHMPSTVRDRAFTHRLDAASRARSTLFSVAGDLEPLLTIHELRTETGEPVETVAMREQIVLWQGPDGWLDPFGDDDLIAVRVDADGVVSVSTVGEIEPSHELIELVRRVAADELEHFDMPVPFDQVVAALIVADPTAFVEPTPPLSELFARAGLDARGGRIARDQGVWHADELEARHERLHTMSDDDEAVHTAMDVLATFDDELSGPEDLRAALRDLDDPDVLGIVLEELTEQLDGDDSEDEAEDHAAITLASRLVAAARRPRDTAIASLVAARTAQTLGNGSAADEHARAAVRADPTFGPGVDLAGYYASVRGDAVTAARLWRSLENPDEGELAGLQRHLEHASPKLGRNDPCWCGSGRKFKTCHQGRVEQPSLPDRVNWLCSKAAGFLHRVGGDAATDLFMMTYERALDPENIESIREAVEDPIVVDAVLTEGGWFERFLETMRDVLPSDEAMLVAAWQLVDRTVFEVAAVDPGETIEVRDIATGDRLTVRERTLSCTVRVGSLLCARAVPDGETTQFIGGIFPVAQGREADVLALCERKDGAELCRWVRDLHAPPTFTTREGEMFVHCTARVRATGAATARAVLDAHYERDGDTWNELVDIGDGERIVRGRLTLVADAIEVSTTSEERMERTLATLFEFLPGATVVSDERKPFRPGDWPPTAADAGGLQPLQLSEPQREELLQMMEERWMSEPVPALGGVTPRDAVADPTRRESVRRLLASFPEAHEEAVLTLRPSRIRAELGL